MEDQIVLVTHDGGEYHVQELQTGEDGTELVHVEEGDPSAVQMESAEAVQDDNCHETLKQIAAEPLEDITLECEGEWFCTMDWKISETV